MGMVFFTPGWAASRWSSRPDRDTPIPHTMHVSTGQSSSAFRKSETWEGFNWDTRWMSRASRASFTRAA